MFLNKQSYLFFQLPHISILLLVIFRERKLRKKNSANLHLKYFPLFNVDHTMYVSFKIELYITMQKFYDL